MGAVVVNTKWNRKIKTMVSMFLLWNKKVCLLSVPHVSPSIPILSIGSRQNENNKNNKREREPDI